MRTKLVEHELFEEIQKRSFDNIKKELNEASQYLSKIANTPLALSSVNEDFAIYNCVNNPSVFLKTRYNFTENETIKFNQFEKVILDENSKINARKEVLRRIVDSLSEDNIDEANEKWNELRQRFSLLEMVKKKAAKPGAGNQGGGDSAKAQNADEEDAAKKGRARANKKGAVAGDEFMNSPELASLKPVDDALEEFLQYLPNFQETKKYLIEAAKEVAKIVCEEETDAVKIKTKKKKDMEYDEDEMDDEDIENGEDDDEDEDSEEIDEIEVDTKKKSDKKKKGSKDSDKHEKKVAKARKKFADKEEDEDFVEAIISIKRDNNARDEVGLKESILSVISENPSIIYVSKNELTSMISRILQDNNETNWNEQLCEDIAEGLRKLAYNAYEDQAIDIIKFAAIDEVVGLDEEVSDDNYEAFETVSERYFNNIYNKAGRKHDALVQLSEMLSKAASIIEFDAKANNINQKRLSNVVSEYRQYAAQLAASARGPINESLVKMVVGSLLSRAAGDYSLNNQAKFVDPGHYHTNWDLDDNQYDKHAKASNKQTVVGDEDMGITNPTAPKHMDPDKLDLEKGDNLKDHGVMRYGIHMNPMAPNAKSGKDLDLL